LIGAEIFRRYVVTMDLPHKLMMLAETPETKTPYEFDMSGMFLTAGGEGFHKFKVLSVVDGGSAASAGIKPGDVIAELDGKSASQLTLEQLRSALREAGTTRTLSIERPDGRHTIKIELRRLV
jgi:carboxyl-terminal processing protease